jgi:threonine dehydratase
MPDLPLRDVPLEEILAAAARIEGRVARTPTLASRSAALAVEAKQGVRLGSGGTPTADARLGSRDAAPDDPRLFVKAEHLQVTGSFKSRGATNRVLTLSAEEQSRGLITLSAGNHAQAVAYAASRAGIPATVVMPLNASRAKVDAAAGYGAEVILHGEHVGHTFARMEQLRDERGLFFLHPFDDPGVIAGQGTVGLEILEDLPDVDVVVVGVGGGGLISGIGAAVKQLRPTTRVIGVEPETSNAVTLGLAAGEPVRLQPISIADGLGAPFAGVWTIDLARRYVDEIVLIDEATIAAGVRFALERMKQLLEPAGASALGAVLAARIDLRDGETVCVVASGGNVDLDRLPSILELAYS